MRNNRFSFLIIAALIFFSSCQKEVDFQNLDGSPGSNPGPGTGNTGSIIGDYNFIGMTAVDTTSVITQDMGMELKAVAMSDYTSGDNSGTLKVTNSQLILSDISYKVKDTVFLEGYLDGTLMLLQSEPFEETIPATSNTADYVRNQPDSITLSNWSFMLPDPSGNSSNVPSGPQTYGIALANDNLTLTTRYDFTTTGLQNGVPATMTVKMNAAMRFKRK